MRRTVRPELLDSNSATDAEIRSSLKDLQFINRWLGGVSTTRSLLQRVLRQHPSRHLSVLDVGSATGDGLANVQRSMNGTRLSCTLLDRSPSHFDGTARTMKAVLGDALSLPFQDDSFDVVLCSGLLYHLDDPAAYIAELGRLTAPGGLLYLDTHVAPEDVDLPQCEYRAHLSALKAGEQRGVQLRWREYAEDVTQAESSVGNAVSLWLDIASHVELLLRAGFSRVFEMHGYFGPGEMDLKRRYARRYWAAVKDA